MINGKTLENSYQIPEKWLTNHKNTIGVNMGKTPRLQNILIGSTLRLEDIHTDQNTINYQFKAFGKNILHFKYLDKQVKVLTNGKAIKTKQYQDHGITYIEFEGTGEFNLILD